jgi:glutamate--cysteine ligase
MLLFSCSHSPSFCVPIQALMARGVQYIEVRCLDINPFLPLGIDLAEARFLDAFLLFCALEDSPSLASAECRAASANFLTVVKEGRRPGLQLLHEGQNVELSTLAAQLLDSIAPLADLLDQSHGGDAHAASLALQRTKVADPSLTPSAQVLAQLQENGESFAQFALRYSRAHAETLRSQPLSAAEQAAFAASVAESLQQQQAMEAEPQGDFDAFVAAYQASILQV